ncbi:MAG: nucleolar RNA-binding Nop10p family protein [Nanoarchaeota archaeon]
MQLKICDLCRIYTMKNACPKCSKPTKEAHYKFKKFLKKEKLISNQPFS